MRRVLLDATMLLSYLLPSRPESSIRVVVQAAIAGQYRFLLPHALLDEVVQKITTKPYFVQRVTAAELQTFVALLQTIGEVIPPITQAIPAVSRDAKDTYLLAYALVGQAEYLVTGDADRLVVRQVEGVRIVTPAEFAIMLRE